MLARQPARGRVRCNVRVRLAVVAASAAWAADALVPPGQNSASLERKVKAAFLYKFLGYT
ncbi:hypothetical protein LP419_02385 [Massilia sp. H-1]|nr:hypothetical protein LP419_02385 [Massilia sp. H-1]